MQYLASCSLAVAPPPLAREPAQCVRYTHSAGIPADQFGTLEVHVGTPKHLACFGLTRSSTSPAAPSIRRRALRVKRTVCCVRTISCRFLSCHRSAPSPAASSAASGSGNHLLLRILNADPHTVQNSFSTNWRCMSSQADRNQSDSLSGSTGADGRRTNCGKIARNP